MTLTTTTQRRAATIAISPRAPRLSLRRSRFHLDPRAEPRATTQMRWIGDLITRR